MSARSVKRLDKGARHRFSSSGLARLLQQWGLLEAPAAWPDLGEQVGRWIGWTDAVALSAVLAAEEGKEGNESKGAELRQRQLREGVDQVRQNLLGAIATDPLFAAASSALGLGSSRGQPASAPDFAACRRQYQAHQRAMERQLAPWREAVRGHLARQSAASAALAALDQAMAGALAERESWLLSRLPHALERRFGVQSPAAFIHDLQALLRAELEFRLEPIEGLLDALALPGAAVLQHPQDALAAQVS